MQMLLISYVNSFAWDAKAPALHVNNIECFVKAQAVAAGGCLGAGFLHFVLLSYFGRAQKDQHEIFAVTFFFPAQPGIRTG
jgi:hypothetical protein